MAALVLVERVAHAAIVAVARCPHNLQPLRDVADTARVLEDLDGTEYFAERNPQLHCDPSFGTKPSLSHPDQMNDQLRAFFAEAMPLLERRLRPWLP